MNGHVLGQRRTAKGKATIELSAEQIDQREKAFVLFRDLGAKRTLHRLATVLKKDHPEIAVTVTTLRRWSTRHGWDKRIETFERAIQLGQGPRPVVQRLTKSDEPIDQIDVLLRTANQALTRAMNAAPAVTRPSDVKTLVDAAANAMKLVESLRSREAGKGVREEIAAAIGNTLDLMVAARFKDVEFVCRAAAAAAAAATAQPVGPILEAAMRSAGLLSDSRVAPLAVDGEQAVDPVKADPGEIDGDPAPDVDTTELGADVCEIDGDPKRADNGASSDESATSFADVLSKFRASAEET